MKHLSIPLLILIILFPLLSNAQQQATPYERLLQRSDQPSSYITDIILPTKNGATVGVMFRLDYDLVPFLRVRPAMENAPENAEYFAPVRMGLEVFEGRHRSSRRNSNDNNRSIFRDSYMDTVYVNSFEQTRSRLQHVQGVLSTNLEPGSYNYELQLTRAQSTREQSSTRRNIQIPAYDTLSTANIVILSEFNRMEDTADGAFLNYGENVLYGSDYQMMIVLPQSDSDQQFKVSIHRMRSGQSEDALSDPTFEHTLTVDEILTGSDYQLERSPDNINFSMNLTENGARFGVISIPNSEFENARYRIQVTDAEGKVTGSKIVNSRWLDMPVSLLNIDVAIDMMKFIVSEDELNRLQRGSSAEKERKFREFWEQRDPTPDTEFNELMTEYYKRIDYAYRNFSSPQTPGYESDQGRAYILYGEPENIERLLPTDQPTQEIWEYPNRTLVFEATSGFGDFKLISEQ